MSAKDQRAPKLRVLNLFVWTQTISASGCDYDNSTSRSTECRARAALTEAHTMLSEVYDWFTEGFDTKDLQDAKALPEELHY
jgi:hypothetical protein